jgi:hypothetical protein
MRRGVSSATLQLFEHLPAYFGHRDSPSKGRGRAKHKRSDGSLKLATLTGPLERNFLLGGSSSRAE